MAELKSFRELHRHTLYFDIDSFTNMSTKLQSVLASTL